MPIVLFFSFRQISAHSVQNFRSSQCTPGRFDNIDLAENICNRTLVGKTKTYSNVLTNIAERLIG